MVARLRSILGAILLTLGVLVLAAGALLAAVIVFYAIVGYGDHEGHFAREDAEIPATIVAAGAVLTWAGCALRRARPPPSSVPPPG